MEIQGEIGKGLTFEIGAQVAKGIALDDETPLDDVPVEDFALQLRKDLGGGNYIQFRSELFGRDGVPGPTEIVTPGYVTMELGGGWWLSPRFQIRFLARNLLDKDYAVSADRRAVLAPGRSGVVTLIAQLP